MTIELHNFLVQEGDSLTSVQTVAEARQLKFSHPVRVTDDNFVLIPSTNKSPLECTFECWPIEMCDLYDYNCEDGSYSPCNCDISLMTNDDVLAVLANPNKALGIRIVDEDFNGYLMSRPTTFFNY